MLSSICEYAERLRVFSTLVYSFFYYEIISQQLKHVIGALNDPLKKIDEYIHTYVCMWIGVKNEPVVTTKMLILHCANKNYTLLEEFLQWILLAVLLLLPSFIANCKYKYLVCLLLTAHKNERQQLQIYIQTYWYAYICMHVSVGLYGAVCCCPPSLFL